MTRHPRTLSLNLDFSVHATKDTLGEQSRNPSRPSVHQNKVPMHEIDKQQNQESTTTTKNTQMSHKTQRKHQFNYIQVKNYSEKVMRTNSKGITDRYTCR